MSLDVGERRIGVAIGDELNMISSPLSVVQRRAGDLAEIRDLAREKGVDRIVVGTAYWIVRS
jgi:RNase H-fold protein (predicted Holliday junction resolvase)